MIAEDDWQRPKTRVDEQKKSFDSAFILFWPAIINAFILSKYFFVNADQISDTPLIEQVAMVNIKPKHMLIAVNGQQWDKISRLIRRVALTEAKRAVAFMSLMMMLVHLIPKTQPERCSSQSTFIWAIHFVIAGRWSQGFVQGATHLGLISYLCGLAPAIYYYVLLAVPSAITITAFSSMSGLQMIKITHPMIMDICGGVTPFFSMHRDQKAETAALTF